MITGELRSKVDSIWDTIWTGGITSPITVLEQITYLMFMKLLDDNQLKAEAGANALGIKLKNRVFGEGICVISENPHVETDYKNLRWHVFHNYEPGAMFSNIQNYVFPFIKQIGEGKDTAFSRYMKDTVFLIPTAKVLAKVVDGIDAMDMNNKDIMGDVYEYLLGKIAAAGENGQFRTPRHIINMMVQLMKPTLKDKILDPAMGSAGFLLESSTYISTHYAKELMKADNAKYYKSGMFSGFDTDQSMLRIGAMNMMLHGVEDPNITYQDSLSGDNNERNCYSLIMANPPFTGSVFQEEISKDLLALCKTKKKDYNARLMFCTYQTMINYIDAEDKRFTSGRFDLIIIDEAHRSIFNKYGSIFAYFDSLLVGLTATPKSEVDANTYRIFGCESGIPNFDYSLEEAVKDKYLVNYKSFSRTTKLLKRGIKYNELTEDEKRQLDEYFVDEPPTPDFTVSEKELFKKIFNKNTCCEILEELMQYGIKTNGGELLGKSIIFAYNHHHAQMIVDCFHELYPEHPANYCQLIDNYVKYADDLILKFENDDEFRIAVSVDMLDTGIDVPAVVNLVFFKPVKSKIKFVQMIGRGTRLCDNLFGEGKDKTHFIIFDYCGNFEYFDAHPDGTDGMGGRSLSQRLFEVRLDILHELQRIEYQEQEFARSYYNKTKDLLHAAVYKIKGHSARMQVRAEMQYVDKYSDYATWESVSPLMVKEIKVHITPLLDSGLEGFDLSIAFDIRMLDIELSMLVQGNTGMATRDVKTVRQVAQYLLTEKASIPQVFAKAEQLKTLVSEQFWDAPSLEKLEQLRVDVRDLMQFLDKSPKKQIDVNIDDTVEPSGYDGGDTIIDIRTYREKVLDYLIEHSDNEVIHKIQRLEPITNEDLKALEKILWEELGTKEEYEQTTDIDNLAVFVRSLIGLSQEAVNEKFGEYLNGNVLNAQQQEFIRAIINYVRENGDISREDLIEKSPFDNYDILTLFGDNITSVLTIVGILHDSVNVAAYQ